MRIGGDNLAEWDDEVQLIESKGLKINPNILLLENPLELAGLNQRIDVNFNCIV